MYVPITLTNNQSTTTPAPFQQSITINPSLYTSNERSDLGNIRFYATFSGVGSFSNELYAWMESYSGSSTPNLATSATIWVNLPSGIPAKSSITIYMVFELTSVTFDRIFWGEAPQLSSTYGEYDNGANVFTVYNNGTSLFPDTQLGSGGSGPAITASAPAPNTRAITGSVSGGSSGANTWTTDGETTTSLPTSYITQILVYLSGSSPLTDLLTNVQSISAGQFYVFRFDARSGSNDLIGNYASGSGSTNVLLSSTTTSTVNTWYQMTAVDSADSLSLYKSTSFDLGNFGTLEAGPVAGKGYTGGGIAVTTDGASSTEYWTMIITRAYPLNGIMPSIVLGSPQLTSTPSVYSDYYVSSTGTIRSPLLALETTTSPAYVPITLTNNRNTPTVKGLEIPLNVNFLAYNSYLISDVGNIRFFNSTTFNSSSELPAWLEYYSGNTTNSANTATSSAVWIALKGTSITANSHITIYMVFENGVDFDGVYWGEAPELSQTYGQYDNGAQVFLYYNVAPTSISGWTTNKVAGLTTTAPTGSYFSSTDAYYANSANGDYMYTQIPALATNETMTFWTYTTGLGNVFFLTSSSGAGQMGRLDGRGGGDYTGLAATSSWTSWSAPSSGLDETTNKWYKYDIVLNGSRATGYIGSATNNLVTLGTATNTISITNKGDYVGLVGDALGASYISYWNGLIIRYLPNGGVFPSANFGTVVSGGVISTVLPSGNAGTVQLTAGSAFYENSNAASSCSIPSIDTAFVAPSTNGSYDITSGSTVCLWSQQYSSSTNLYSGTWALDLWANASTSGGSLGVSIYTTNSTGGLVSTIVSGGSTSSIGTTKSEVNTTTLSGGQGVVDANGYIEVKLSAPASVAFTVYWGYGQPTNFQSPMLFKNVLVLNNPTATSWLINLGVVSSSGTARMGNLTIAFQSPSSTQILMGTFNPTQQTIGPQVILPASSATYISVYASAESLGATTVVMALKIQSNPGGPYTQYALSLVVD